MWASQYIYSNMLYKVGSVYPVDGLDPDDSDQVSSSPRTKSSICFLFVASSAKIKNSTL